MKPPQMSLDPTPEPSRAPTRDTMRGQPQNGARLTNGSSAPPASTFPFEEVVGALGRHQIVLAGAAMSMPMLTTSLLGPILAGQWDHPFVDLVRQGIKPPLDDWTTPTSRPGIRRLIRGEVVKLMREGFTLKVQNIELGVAAARDVVIELERRSGRYCSAVFFMTPSGGSGLSPHHDDADVVVEQVQGRKRWRVWTPEHELPARAGVDAEPAGACHELVLGPGDLAYIPRGWTHVAQTLGTEPSVHVSYCLRESVAWRELCLSVSSPA